jgi:predicted murein hydrolase (TIGR00659 family)
MSPELRYNTLIGVGLTLGVYLLAHALFRRSGRHPLCHPVLVSVVALVAILYLTRMPYAQYIRGAQFIDFLLGPAVVALAVPLHRQIGKAATARLAIAAGIGTGALVAVTSAVGIAWLFGASHTTLLSLVPKSVTAPVAMEISRNIGGIEPLSAVFAILTGILGASLGPTLLDTLGIKDALARGIALGTVSHGIGTARALEESETAGAFSGLAMGIMALTMAFLVPWLGRLF